MIKSHYKTGRDLNPVILNLPYVSDKVSVNILTLATFSQAGLLGGFYPDKHICKTGTDHHVHKFLIISKVY